MLRISPIQGCVPNFGIIRKGELVSQFRVHLIPRADWHCENEATVQDVDILSELATLEDVVALEPHRLVLVLGSEGADGCGQTAEDESKSRGGACASVSHEFPFRGPGGQEAPCHRTTELRIVERIWS